MTGYDDYAKDLRALAALDEPGMYAVVSAHGVEWAHLRDHGSFNDWLSATGIRARWSELTDPILVRAGVES